MYISYKIKWFKYKKIILKNIFLKTVIFVLQNLYIYCEINIIYQTKYTGVSILILKTCVKKDCDLYFVIKT